MHAIGRYDLKRRIGAGGMAEVWLAQQRGPFAGASKTVAVKLIGGHLADDPGFQEMFEAEVRLSMLLSHSNIVQVFDAGREAERTYLVMEWVDGLDLARLASLARRSAVRIDTDVAVHIVAELLRGLSYAHRLVENGKPAGIVHRDVSPHNVLVSVSGEVKLTDFGVARLAHDRTTTHDIRGKLRYMAPEQAAGSSRSPRVDLYAVGAILHELAEGRKFREDVPADVLYATARAGEIPELRQPLAAEVDSVRRKLLATDPEQRFQTADEALAALQAWPGFRHAEAALARLCARFMGVDAPRPAAFERTHRSGQGLDGTATETATNIRAGSGSQTQTQTQTPWTESELAASRKRGDGRFGVALAVALGSIFLVAIAVGGFATLWTEPPDVASVSPALARMHVPASLPPTGVEIPQPAREPEPEQPEPTTEETPTEQPLPEPTIELPAPRAKGAAPKRPKVQPKPAPTPPAPAPVVPPKPSTADLPLKPSTSEVRAAFRKHSAAARRCAASVPALRGDRMHAKATLVGVSGKVSKIEVSRDLGHPGVARCVESELGKAQVSPFSKKSIGALHKVSF